ncbi:MAG TPA: multicopper oxidase family protein [Candidatus Binatia bacterium]|nr:multicopper oxidase family protein [Candidatus Binatia bacterium]
MRHESVVSADRGRRRLLLGAGATALGLGGLDAGLTVLRRSPEIALAGTMPGVREFVIETREVTWELAPGKTVRGMAYNGRIPGPEIRVKEGERVRVVLKNALREPTTIHWHGVDVPNAMDGVPGVTQEPVSPGGTFVYEFEARPAGTRWYHTHFQGQRQMDLGLGAPLVIESAGREPVAFDREHTLVLDDWATGTGPALPPTREGTAGGRGGMGGMMSEMRGGRGGMGGMMGRGMMGGRGMGGMMGGNTHDVPYDVMTINGKAYPATERLRVRKGERVRLRLINASADHTHVLRLAGHRLRVTHTDGNPLVEAVEVDAVPIAPSERYDVLLVADRPGAWFLQCVQPGHAEAGERMVVFSEGVDPAKPESVPEGIAGLVLWDYTLGRGRDVLARAPDPARVFSQALSGGMMGSDRWTINGKQYPDTDPIAVRKGDLVRVRLGNMSMEAHPMHLHGQSFRVLAVNGRRLGTPLVKDSVDVEAHMGAVEIEFPAHNPGEWFFHCHKPMHMDGGMITLVKVAG